MRTRGMARLVVAVVLARGAATIAVSKRHAHNVSKLLFPVMVEGGPNILPLRLSMGCSSWLCSAIESV